MWSKTQPQWKQQKEEENKQNLRSMLEVNLLKIDAWLDAETQIKTRVINDTHKDFLASEPE